MKKFFDMRVCIRSVISIVLLVAFGLAILPAPVTAGEYVPPRMDIYETALDRSDDHPWNEMGDPAGKGFAWFNSILYDLLDNQEWTTFDSEKTDRVNPRNQTADNENQAVSNIR